MISPVHISHDEKGSALVSALFAAAVLSLLAAAVLSLSAASAQSSGHWTTRLGAFYAAESGINEALWRLNAGQVVPRRHYPLESPSLTSPPDLLGPDVSYQVWVEDTGGNVVLVTARGMRGSSTRVVQARIRIATASLFDGTAPSGIIRCDASPRPANCDAMPVDVAALMPGQPPADTTFTVDRGNSATVGPGNGTLSYSWLTLKDNATLTIQGPVTVYVTQGFYFGKNATLTLQGDVTLYLYSDLKVGEGGTVQVSGTANIYARGDLEFDQGSALATDGVTNLYVRTDLRIGDGANVGTDPRFLTVFMDTTSGPRVEIAPEAVVQGGIYAPAAEVILEDHSSLTGAVVGGTVDLNGDASVTYDPGVSLGGTGTGVVSGGWGVVQ